MRTPFLLMDEDTIVSQCQEFKKAFRKAQVFYSLKANPDEDIISLLDRLDLGFEVSSEGELDLLIEREIPPQRIISSNPVKSPSFIQRAKEYGIDRFAFDSEEELSKLSLLAPRSRVYVRLEVDNTGSEWPLTRKFGTPPERASLLLRRAREKKLIPYGVTFHVGSQCVNILAFRKAILKARGVLGEFEGQEPFMLNLGGGFPITYRDPVPSISQIAQEIKDLIPEGVELMVEPGRALVGEAGMMVASILGSRIKDGEKWLYLDVGVFNGLLESIGGIRYPLFSSKEGEREKWIVAGPSCDSMDTIGEAELPSLEVGDKVHIGSAGAYTISYASHFNGFPPPKVYLRKGPIKLK
jgi:ornithine decarboxylase